MTETNKNLGATAGAVAVVKSRVGRPPSHRPSFKDGYRRAVSGDEEFGHVCPRCAGPKTDQALRCRKCLVDERRRELRSCPECDGPVSVYALRCRDCANLAKVGVPVGSGRPQEQSHPWRKPSWRVAA